MFCTVFGMHWTEIETDADKTLYIQKGGTETHFQYLVCAKDDNTLSILIRNNPRKLSCSVQFSFVWFCHVTSATLEVMFFKGPLILVCYRNYDFH